jgi:hypothetical protein
MWTEFGNVFKLDGSLGLPNGEETWMKNSGEIFVKFLPRGPKTFRVIYGKNKRQGKGCKCNF